MSEDETRMKTLWTQTLFDDLYSALNKGKSDAEIKRLLVDLKNKDMPLRYVIKKIHEDVGATSAKRVEALLAGKSTAAAAKKKGSGGLVGSLKGLFK